MTLIAKTLTGYRPMLTFILAKSLTVDPCNCWPLNLRMSVDRYGHSRFRKDQKMRFCKCLPIAFPLVTTYKTASHCIDTFLFWPEYNLSKQLCVVCLGLLPEFFWHRSLTCLANAGQVEFDDFQWGHHQSGCWVLPRWVPGSGRCQLSGGPPGLVNNSISILLGFQNQE